MNISNQIADLASQVAHLSPSDYDLFLIELQVQRRLDAHRLSKEESDILKPTNEGFAVEKSGQLNAVNEKIEAEDISEDHSAILETLIAKNKESTDILVKLFEKNAAARNETLGDYLDRINPIKLKKLKRP